METAGFAVWAGGVCVAIEVVFGGVSGEIPRSVEVFAFAAAVVSRSRPACGRGALCEVMGMGGAAGTRGTEQLKLQTCGGIILWDIIG